MNEFEALIESLFQHVLDGVGKDHLTYVSVEGDERTATADIHLVLRWHSWDEMSRAIDRMVDLREMFFGEIAIGYTFIEEVPTGGRREVDSPVHEYAS